MRYLCLFFCILLTPFAFCYDNYLNGSRFTALSGCGVALPDVWSVSNNQAGLAYINNPAFALGHERKFMLKEFSLNSLAAALPYKSGTFGFQINYFGFSKYNEIKIGMAYALKLSKRFSAGLQLDQFRYSIPSLGIKNSWITFELGLLEKVTNTFTIGLHVFNPIPGNTETTAIPLQPSYTKFGFNYSPIKNVNLLSEVEIGLHQQASFRFGAEYFVSNSLSLQHGISSNPFKYSFGVGYNWKKFSIGIAFPQHPYLGYSPVFDIKYNL